MQHRGITLTHMSLHKMLRRPFKAMGVSVTLLTLLGVTSHLVTPVHARQPKDVQEKPATSTTSGSPAAPASPAVNDVRIDLPIMKLADVRIGMKGYGLTVFHGTKIEPFPVEVISIQNDFEAGRGVVWVRCPDDRMQRSGPVHGMSGSPIFLWPLGEQGTPGQGGRMIGAFAFGYSYAKDCYVGIQPIEYMMETASRLGDHDTAAPAAAASAGNPAQGVATLKHLLAASAAQGYAVERNWQAQILTQALENISPSAATLSQGRLSNLRFTSTIEPAAVAPAALPANAAAAIPGQPMKMLMPINVGTPDTARFMASIMNTTGIVPLASGSTIAAAPPSEIDADSVTFAPGSVLSVPLAWGDMDLSASGTVTALTTDGRVLGFGHAMFGEGAVAVPMATGYVHFVMPTLASSFKLGGSLQLKGSIGRDEQAAVVGSSQVNYTTAPVRVSVKMPNQPRREYRYEMIHHRSLTPMLCAILSIQSITAVQKPPVFNTMHVKATLRYSDTEVVNINSYIPMADPQYVASRLMPALVLMADNPYETRHVQAVQVDIEYLPEVLSASITRGQILRPVVKPGEDLDITLWLQPYSGKLERKTIRFTVPHNQPDGDYELLVGGANLYMQLVLGTKRHLTQPRDINSLFQLIKRVLEADNTALYCVLESAQPGLAVGTSELPGLPSSRMAMFTGAASTFTSHYPQWTEKVIPTRRVIDGGESFTIHVRKSGELSDSER